MKKVAVIQDLSSFGKCSLTAAIPVLSVMGVQPNPLPTAVLSAQTDYPSFFYEDLTTKMPYFTEEWQKMNVTFDGIYTGFVTGREQIDNIFAFLQTFAQPNTFLLVDPVMGDRGEAYKLFTEDMLARMRALVAQASVITPNVTECCLLTGLSYEKLYRYKGSDFMQALTEVGQQLQQTTEADVIITGVTPPTEQTIGNLYINANHTLCRMVPFNGKNYSGTGDLFASVIVGGVMRGMTVDAAIQLAETFLIQAITATTQAQTKEVEGVQFERYLHLLL
ncbi:MAG TPA: pyridoxamine kinase [Metalysinibacillus jejuensis]|uniref:pyridoxal kinase n=1 Tax=Metalysinibacillus jejuensis TaxID=914327 RepID=A0A921NB43_9BACL|nr:pyridoxamine kinase [Metalysinibacillus jejuensis]